MENLQPHKRVVAAAETPESNAEKEVMENGAAMPDDRVDQKVYRADSMNKLLA